MFILLLVAFCACMSLLNCLALVFAFCVYRPLFLVHATFMVFMCVSFVAWCICLTYGCSYLPGCCQSAADVCMWCLAWAILFGWIGCFVHRRLMEGIPFASRWMYHGESWACSQFYFVMLVQCPCPFLCVAPFIMLGLCIGSRVIGWMMMGFSAFQYSFLDFL